MKEKFAEPLAMNIRKATLDDFSALHLLQQKLVRHERPFDPTIKEGDVEYYDLKHLIVSEKAQFLVAEIGGSIVGCGFGELRKDVPYSVNKHIGYIGLM